jgi:hypothetical protein
MSETRSYPSPGTRVRWTSRGKQREGVVVEALGATAVLVNTVNGRPASGPGSRRYYHPRPQWLEVVETPVGGGIYTSADQPEGEA